MTSYNITEQLYTQAMAYAQKRSRSIILGVCIFVPMAIYMMKGFQRATLMSVLIVYVILAFYFLVLAPVINRMVYQRTYRKNPLLHKPQGFEISEEEVRFRSENGESHYRLDDLKRLMIYPELVMIYPTTTIFHVIPKEALKESELEILKQNVRQ